MKAARKVIAPLAVPVNAPVTVAPEPPEIILNSVQSEAVSSAPLVAADPAMLPTAVIESLLASHTASPLPVRLPLLVTLTTFVSARDWSMLDELNVPPQSNSSPSCDRKPPLLADSLIEIVVEEVPLAAAHQAFTVPFPLSDVGPSRVFQVLLAVSEIVRFEPLAWPLMPTAIKALPTRLGVTAFETVSPVPLPTFGPSHDCLWALATCYFTLPLEKPKRRLSSGAELVPHTRVKLTVDQSGTVRPPLLVFVAEGNCDPKEEMSQL